MKKFEYVANKFGADGCMQWRGKGTRQANSTEEVITWLCLWGFVPHVISEIVPGKVPYSKRKPSSVRGGNMVENIILTETAEEVIQLVRWWNHFTVRNQPTSTDKPEEVERAVRNRMLDFGMTDLPTSRNLQDWEEWLNRQGKLTDETPTPQPETPTIVPEPDEEWTQYMSKRRMMDALGLDYVHQLNKFIGRYGGYKSVSRKSHRVRIDKMHPTDADKLRNA